MKKFSWKEWVGLRTVAVAMTFAGLLHAAVAQAEDEIESARWAGANSYELDCDAIPDEQSEGGLWMKAATPAQLQDKSISWGPEGHFNTSGTVAKIAGWSMRDARILSCYSQLPDQVSRFDAVHIGLYYFFWPNEYHHLIMNTLHSLHGGKPEAVQQRRERLAKRLLAMTAQARKNKAEGKVDPDLPWQMGLVIHALGDSYAHVKKVKGGEKAFGSWVGHLFSGHTPDRIANPENVQRYAAFVRALFASLVVAEGREGVRDDFIAKVQVAAASGSEANVKAVIIGFSVYDGGKVPPGAALFTGYPYRKTISEKEVVGFLRSLRQELESGN